MSQKTARRRRSARRAFRRPSPGAPPGTFHVDPEAPAPRICVIAYGAAGVEERRDVRVDEVRPFLERWPVTWVNVDGLGDAEVIRRIGEVFGLHRLALEDVVHVRQRAKVEEYREHVFIVARDASSGEALETEQISLFVGKGFVLSFQERVGDCFDPVRARIRAEGSRLRESGPDYLAYALLDALIDGYFPLVEKIGDDLEALEEQVVRGRDKDTVERIQAQKARVLALRRAIWPHRDAVNALLRHEQGLFREDTRLHLRDVYDHTMQIIELLESYRETAMDLVSVHLSVLSNRLNEVMKVLTVIATLFIPLSFIAGVYGMNFDPSASPWNMPELRSPWGYPAVLALMVAVVVGLLFFFRRRGLLG